MEVNKAFAAVLTAGIVFMGFSQIGKMVVYPHQLERTAIQVNVPEPAATAAAPAPAALEPIAPLLASADAAAGQRVFAQQCGACHSVNEGGRNGTGPNLWGVIGGPHAHAEGFNYSNALRGKANEPWTFEAMNAWLANPRAAIPGNRMSYQGLRSAQDRANVILFMRNQDSSPEPLP
jgi:cytochrome c